MIEEYSKKRDFEKTPEPSPSSRKPDPENPVYVIQKHNASKLHYDLRLEMNGVLKSWAIPKEPSKNPDVKRLAIQTEDHPLEYADFEGEIPEGQYGAGTVEIWDKGTFEPVKTEDEEIIFRLKGNKLEGDYVLIKTKYGKDKNSWLFFKKKND
ncbi:DNA ligase D, 3'-phosphoesterase domain protein [Methanohalobium evestigatum Z-7303]|uniref:DNA ligase D, 3'-phosphoesterase domain protein n=1 Tax=Methanohalobium evestigatum (strain ATCC BAA-1072 / DSM 3721 / NBRC 107634 / OCM 161 / Z-7303) TaxID=644295 RepID=D7E8L8_METEZ|nr:DNA polymerase ligase N-terminal domain-containing protein [Methanohalobium evestigatum]ADI73689.1 DNA ligase D, 3'-phosphoesterase domain protein [Methanohalobium evestigatum Z-7303]